MDTGRAAPPPARLRKRRTDKSCTVTHKTAQGMNEKMNSGSKT